MRRGNRCAWYVRVSTKDQSTGLQLADLRALTDGRGFELVKIYEDAGVSGAKASRPGLNEMMRDARRGAFDILVVWKTDRLGRSLKNLLQILEELDSLGVAFVSRGEGWDTSTPAGRMMMQIAGVFAEYEREVLRERSMAGQAKARREGRNPGRPRAEVDHALIAQLKLRGLSLQAIAEKTGTSKATVYRRLRCGPKR